ncbi:MAG: NYN domain-containing protein [Paracoccaceae bacterium]
MAPALGKTLNMYGLPLLQHFVTVTSSEAANAGMPVGTVAILFVLALVVLGIIGFLAEAFRNPSPRARRPQRRPRGQRAAVAPRSFGDDRQAVLVDGSNVIYWLDNTPQLAPLLQVVHDLQKRGLKPGVVFDANIGYKLTGAFMGERDLSRILSLPRDQILVVPKGKQADPFLLETARNLNARIVTNDRYRDWIDRYPDVARPDMLVTGEMRGGRVSLRGMETKDGAKTGAR